MADDTPRINPLVPLISLIAFLAVNGVIAGYALHTGVFSSGAHAAGTAGEHP